MYHMKLRRLIAALTVVTLLLDPLGAVFAAPRKRKGETQEEYNARTAGWWNDQDDKTEKWLKARKGKGAIKPGDWKGLGVRTKEDAQEILHRLTKKHGRGTISAAEERQLMAAISGREKYNEMIAKARESGTSGRRAQDEFWTSYWKNQHGAGTKDEVALAKATDQGWWEKTTDRITSWVPYPAPRTLN